MSLNGYSWVEGNPINLTDSSGMQLQNPSSPGQKPDLVIVRPPLQPYSNAPLYADYPYDQYETPSPGYNGLYVVIPEIVETGVGYIDTSRIGELGYAYPANLLSFNGQCLSPALFEPGPAPYLTVINLQSNPVAQSQPAQEISMSRRFVNCNMPSGYSQGMIWKTNRKLRFGLISGAVWHRPYIDQ